MHKHKHKKDKNNIVFIGMPGAGKSTIGRVVAERLGLRHIDGDAIMEEFEGMKLQDIIDIKGNDYVLELEGKVLRELDVENCVISPGGSCVYYPDGMENLRSIATVVYLEVSWPVLEKRCTNIFGRGIIFKPGETLKDLYEMRTPLYEKYAEIIIDSSDFDREETARAVLKALKENG